METDFIQLRKAKHIWIYGAGVVGKRAYRELSEEAIHLPLEGMAVTKQPEEQGIEGRRVVGIDDIADVCEDTVFVIAVSKKYQAEVIETLVSKGYSNYIIWRSELGIRKWYLTDYQFEDRSKGLSKVCLVLGGYKEFLWDIVFERLARFVPEDVEVCILSSGLYSDKLSQIAENNDWSYLSTELNDVTLIQNIGIHLFPEAEWIYKMDEDIFVTTGCFENMMRIYTKVESEEPYKVGFVAPLIPVNGYGHIRILDYLGKRQKYERRFERVIYGCYPESMLESMIEAAGFMWGAGGDIPQLDSLNDMFSVNETYSVCGVRFSIGFILLHRSVWEAMKGFPVSGKVDLGADEAKLCQFCMGDSRAIIVAENTTVGHFSFKQQAEKMKKFYDENQELFQIKE